MKKVIRLTESDLHRIVNESVQRILTEEMDEGLFGGLGLFGRKYGNMAKNAGNSMVNAAIQNAVKALQNLKAADQKLQSIGQYSVIGKQGALIDQLLKVLASVGGRFKARASAFANA